MPGKSRSSNLHRTSQTPNLWETDYPALKPEIEHRPAKGEIEDYDDLRTLCDQKTRAHAEPTRSLDDVLKDIGN